ncbi:MAG: lipid-A-disaccharide synthase [Burkholderiales bacterium]
MFDETQPQSLRTVKIALVAGEASGDLLGAYLIQAIKVKYPHAEFIGIGGPKMISAGIKSLFLQERLAVHGYSLEILRRYREIIGIRRQLKRHFVEQRPDVFVGIDAPDFNLTLERQLKRSGIPTVHYVGPSIWAWRGKRIRKILSAVSHMLVLFPFEKGIYEKAGLPATYVGHPLADILPLKPNQDAARELLKLPRSGPVIALLPGSRQSEVKALSELYIRTAQHILTSHPNTFFLVPLISRETRKHFEAELYRMEAKNLPLTILFGHAHEAITAADVVLVASGTATLETALLKRPMVITYKMPKLSWSIIKRKRYQPYVGLPNILEGEFVVPELLQSDATPENLAQALLNIYHDKTFIQTLQLRFEALHLRLRKNTAEKAASAIFAFLERKFA